MGESRVVGYDGKLYVGFGAFHPIRTIETLPAIRVRYPDLSKVKPSLVVPAGLIVAAAAIAAPGPVDRRGFVARAGLALAGLGAAIVDPLPVVESLPVLPSAPPWSWLDQSHRYSRIVGPTEFRGSLKLTELLERNATAWHPFARNAWNGDVSPDAVSKSVARWRRSKNGRAWMAAHWQGPRNDMGGMLDLKMRQATSDLQKAMARMYEYESGRQWLVAGAGDGRVEWGFSGWEPKAPTIAPGLALAAAVVAAPGPTSRRGFFACIAAAAAGVASAAVPTAKTWAGPRLLRYQDYEHQDVMQRDGATWVRRHGEPWTRL
jgi:hypothetical protein